jgi:chromosome segregation ATPase
MTPDRQAREQELITSIKDEMSTIMDAEKENRDDCQGLKDSIDRLQKTVARLEQKVGSAPEQETRGLEGNEKIPHKLKIKRKRASSGFLNWLFNNNEV